MREQVDAVQRMQDYIESHLGVQISLEQLAAAAGYSPWHATRLFKEIVGIPPSEYLRARRLSRAALQLRDTSDRVLDVALDTAFASHEGFTRAFSERFGLTPEQYRKGAYPLVLFLPRSARAYFLHTSKGGCVMTEKTQANTIFVQVVERPARKLILLRGRKATDYWGYCEEVGCDVWGTLTSLKGAVHEPIGMWLPDSLRTPGTSVYAQGVEMPADYSGPVPEGMELIDLPSCRYMIFHGEPYQDDQMGQAIAQVWRAMDSYKPELYGWEWADDAGPRFQLAPVAERGYMEGRPVREAKRGA
ncbi:MAG TPA: AraC family transcriptional regulator [Symbiobacteriaceae bacterium]|nr:AraC family transcriptional regulator [Symbiobacteriaceae bacterium]